MISFDENNEGGQIDFYFDFISPYGWMAAEKIGDVARRYNLPLHWHPFMLKVTVVDIMKSAPPLTLPMKGTYLLHDIERCLRYSGHTLHTDAKFGFSSLIPSRAIVWAKENYPDKVEELVRKLYRCHWSQGKDISLLQNTLDIIVSVGLPSSLAEQAISSPACKQKFKLEVDAAVASNVFGSPTMRFKGENFWGADRLAMFEEWLIRGGW